MPYGPVKVPRAKFQSTDDGINDDDSFETCPSSYMYVYILQTVDDSPDAGS